jgi:hypothetical protein
VFEALSAIRMMRKALGQNFDGHSVTEAAVARAIDFAHAAGAEWGKNFVRPKFRA